jgi:hypothetical protein
MARALAATQLLNRGFGAVDGCEKFIPDRREYYVYSIHGVGGRLVYIGKGLNRRALQSAKNHNGKHRIRAKFTSEKAALGFERRLIRRFRPPGNLVYNKPFSQALNA